MPRRCATTMLLRCSNWSRGGNIVARGFPVAANPGISDPVRKFSSSSNSTNTGSSSSTSRSFGSTPGRSLIVLGDPPLSGCPPTASRHWSSTTVGTAPLPEGSVAPGEGLAAVQRLVSASLADDQPFVGLLGDQRVTQLLVGIGEKADELSNEQIHSALVIFARASYMPPEVWAGLEKELPRAAEQLPDNQVVHMALLMASLDLRGNMLLLHELADQLELRAADMTPTLLAGSVIALSQLGPWAGHVPGGTLAESLRACFHKLGVRELSASALAVATLGVGEQLFWHEVHGVLLGRLEEMTARHLTDVLMALASTQLCPITLLESLLARLALKARQMDWEEGVVCLWALCAVQLFPAATVRDILEQACDTGGVPLSPLQANQLKQVLLTLELERSAAKASAEVPPVLRKKADLLCADAAGELSQGLVGHTAEAEELGELLAEKEGTVFALAEDVNDFYVLDVVVRPKERNPVVVLFDAVSPSTAEAPLDPWLTLKRRHLLRLGWPEVHWLPCRRWRTWDEEERCEYAAYLVNK